MNADHRNECLSEAKLSDADRFFVFELTDLELMEMTGHIPLSVQIRTILNKAGFKFTDDRSFSWVTNENPTPTGRFVRWYDAKKMKTFFKQWV